MNPSKIKKIIYSILKEILEGESVPTAEDYEISNKDFVDIVKLMVNENYLNSKKVSFFITGGVSIDKSFDTVTMSGISFLEENNGWSKFYKGIKEFKNFILK